MVRETYVHTIMYKIEKFSLYKDHLFSYGYSYTW